MAVTTALRLPRGVRNHNPGNIRRTKTVWQGQAVKQTDDEFVCFETPTMGLRALMKVLLSYYRTHGLNTVRKIIQRYAPPNENDTEIYIKSTAHRLGVDPDGAINPATPDMLVALAKAICRHECGPAPQGQPLNWYSDDTYEEAARLALGK